MAQVNGSYQYYSLFFTSSYVLKWGRNLPLFESSSSVIKGTGSFSSAFYADFKQFYEK
ncbi:hypothetical protein FC85_GL002477 [Lentilactobacillus diolivorans DSM 14421]|uniref:Uncharacterized protein n=1 Tax=Lentilactobacillus diolivorans DSM 14421 TaxID=1423739 RepID=A0A0R1SGP5_9LACO|nr:hypothetical protein FC85_GL002477 [Lentilactobacillus diolivorans DSM 14421]